MYRAPNNFVPGRCTGIPQPYDASVQAHYQLTFLDDVVMSTLTQFGKHAKRIVIDDTNPLQHDCLADMAGLSGTQKNGDDAGGELPTFENGRRQYLPSS